MKYFTDVGDGEAEVRAGALEWLAYAAGPSHRAANIAVTTSAPAKTCAAVRSKAPASPRKALLRIIISVVSRQVGENSAGVLGRAPERDARPRVNRTVLSLLSRLRQGRAMNAEDLPRFMRLATGEPRP